MPGERSDERWQSASDLANEFHWIAEEVAGWRVSSPNWAQAMEKRSSCVTAAVFF